ncbi:MAG TPA: hypothetical protein ENF73_00640 [Proteobacteria bacterium]|nr:hypothetical protein [Pseudomonadota bacterium]
MSAKAKKVIALCFIFGLPALIGIVQILRGAVQYDSFAKALGTWYAAFLTLAIISFLYDDNPFYRFAEALFIGVSAAYWMVIGVWTVLVPNLFGRLTPWLVKGLIEGLEGQSPRWAYIIPLVLGILLLMRLSRKYGWISRWSLAFIVGTTAGLNFVQYFISDFMEQVRGSMVPLIVFEGGSFSLWGTFSNIVLFLGVLCGLIYFFFSVEHKGVFGVASRIGIWILMISFGASFGFTVMGRIALLVGRMEFLLYDWLGLAPGM